MNTAKQQANLRQEQHIWHHQEGVQLALKFEKLYTHYMAVGPIQDIQQGSHFIISVHIRYMGNSVCWELTLHVQKQFKNKKNVK
jgi:hypothetical protein